MTGLLATALVAACNNIPASSDQTAQTSMPKALIYDVTTKVTDGKVSAELTTNLPDNTRVMGTLWAEFNDTRYMAQSTGIVKNGAATVGPFSARSKPLKSGQYDLSISVSDADLQDDDVREAVGDNYSNYRGDVIVQNGKGGRYIVREVVLTLPD